ncbi:hypothetical protein [Acidovorax delafieldii]|uniref:hypothetical protein n=1 Tax=Acidovorax delafieldii TaxID=47920 RepID=UPI003CC7D6DC
MTDEQLVDGMSIFCRAHAPGGGTQGCLGFAAASEMRVELRGQRVGVVISSGGVNLARLGALLVG